MRVLVRVYVNLGSAGLVSREQLPAALFPDETEPTALQVQLL